MEVGIFLIFLTLGVFLYWIDDQYVIRFKKEKGMTIGRKPHAIAIAALVGLLVFQWIIIRVQWLVVHKILGGSEDVHFDVLNLIIEWVAIAIGLYFGSKIIGYIKRLRNANPDDIKREVAKSAVRAGAEIITDQLDKDAVKNTVTSDDGTKNSTSTADSSKGQDSEQQGTPGQKMNKAVDDFIKNNKN